MKLVFNKCHVNKFNLYNQVGLIACNCMGEMYNAFPSGGTQQSLVGNHGARHSALNPVLPNLTMPNLEEELSMDKSTLETMKAVYAAKERAVAMEDFDEAKRLKETIERLKLIAG